MDGIAALVSVQLGKPARTIEFERIGAPSATSDGLYSGPSPLFSAPSEGVERHARTVGEPFVGQWNSVGGGAPYTFELGLALGRQANR